MDRPQSLRNPPVPSGAEQVAAGTPKTPITEHYEAKELHFETALKPEDVYNFYLQSLTRDGWSNYGAYAGYKEIPAGVVLLPGSAQAAFSWQCRTGLSPGGISSIIWLDAQALNSDKTRVTLNYEYVP